MDVKRLTLFAGHYGSGKTNIALNYALYLKSLGYPVTMADLDIVNPYFRMKDSEALLNSAGIRLICSPYANSNVDFPAMPKEIYWLVADTEQYGVMDIGGDDRGALALGRYVPDILAEDNYSFLLVANKARPLTRTAQDTIDVMHEIEETCGMRFTGLINNTNLGLETTAEDVLDSADYIEQIASMTSLPVVMTCARRELAESLEGRVKNLFPIDLQKLYYMLNTEVPNGKSDI